MNKSYFYLPTLHATSTRNDLDSIKRIVSGVIKHASYSTIFIFFGSRKSFDAAQWSTVNERVFTLANYLEI